MKDEEFLYILNSLAENMYQNLCAKYTQNGLIGKCIEATDALVENYKQYGLNAKAKRVFVLYQNYYNCTDLCFEEHWLVDVERQKKHFFVDTTISQFQWASYLVLPPILISNQLPTFYLPRKPSKQILKDCGWTDWYENGIEIEPNFVWSL